MKKIAGGVAAVALLLAGCGSDRQPADPTVQAACSTVSAKVDELYAAASAAGGPVHRANVPDQAKAAMEALKPNAVQGTSVESAFSTAATAWDDYVKAGQAASGEDDPNLTVALVRVFRAQDGVIAACRDAGVEMKVRDSPGEA